jgi:hypothetical protein
VEWIVGALVVLGFVAIAVRFVPRDDALRVRLPRIVDDSLGMWALRRLTRRPLGDSGGVGPGPIVPSRFVASAARLEALGVRPAGRARSSGSTRRLSGVTRVAGSTTRRRQADPAASMAQQRRLAAIAAILVVGAVALGVVLASRGPQGEVHGATGRPALSNVSPSLSIFSSPSTEAQVATPTLASTKRPIAPVATPRRTPTPAPQATPRPTATPKPTPTPTPTLAPTASPTPTATPPPPPVASVACTSSSLTVTCDASDSARAMTYQFVFDNGPTFDGSDATAMFTYPDGGTYTITLTVADSLGRTSTDVDTVTVP